MSHQVIVHHHDEEDGVYRLVIGIPQVTKVPDVERMEAEHGRVQEAIEEHQQRIQEAVDNDSELPDDEPPSLPYFEREELVGHLNVEDFVWADDDDRWLKKGKRRPAGDIAAEQRQDVKDALAERERLAQEEAERPAPKPMPGAGGEL